MYNYYIIIIILVHSRLPHLNIFAWLSVHQANVQISWNAWKLWPHCYDTGISLNSKLALYL